MMKITRSALERPLAWLAAFTLLTLVLAWQLLGIEIRTDGAALYPRGNEIIDRSALDRVTFDDPEHVIVLVQQHEGGPALESYEGYVFLRAVHLALDSLPITHENGVISAVNQLDVSTKSSLYSVQAYLDNIPRDPQAFAALRTRLHDERLTNGLFLDKGGTTAAFYLPVKRGTDRAEAIEEIQHWITTQGGSDFEIRTTGPVVAEVLLGEMVIQDLLWLVPLMMLAITVLLLLTLRTAAGVAIPMIEVLFTLIWTLGLMAVAGVPITLVTTIMPIILVAMAITDEIHLLERLQTHIELRGGASISRAERKQAFLDAISDVKRPVILTSLTTAAGFLSFLTTSVAPMQHFGVFTSIGILLAMFISFSLIPAMGILMPDFMFKPLVPDLLKRRAADSHAAAAGSYKRWGLRASLAILCLAVPGIMMLTVQDSWVDNFDHDSDLVAAERSFNQHFWGSYRFDVILAAKSGMFEKQEGLKLVRTCKEIVKRGPYVGGVASVLDPFEGAAKVLGGDAHLLELPPDSLEMVDNIANFFHSRVSLHQFLSGAADSTRLRIFVNSPDFARSVQLRSYLRDSLEAAASAAGVDVHYSGDIPVAMEVVGDIVDNQLRSIGASLVGVVILLLIFLRGDRTALVLMVPVVLATALMLAAMGYLDIPLGIATSMFTPLAIGVGIDFSLHYAHRYKSHRAAGLDHAQAVHKTAQSSGRAIAWNATVLALGFLVLTLSALKPNHSLGVLLAGAMVACYGTTMFILPRLLWRTYGDGASPLITNTHQAEAAHRS